MLQACPRLGEKGWGLVSKEGLSVLGSQVVRTQDRRESRAYGPDASGWREDRC